MARNAAESLALHKTRRASDLTTRSRALHEIQEALGLDEAPLRIECYDVSNLQGTHVVASMVVFEDGLARKGEYRRFSIRGLDGTDDVAAIHEVILRRFRRYLDEREATGELDSLGDPEVSAEAARQRKFAYPPNLVVIDGGPAQVAAAARAPPCTDALVAAARVVSRTPWTTPIRKCAAVQDRCAQPASKSPADCWRMKHVT